MRNQSLFAKMTALALVNNIRTPLLPETPTLADLGYKGAPSQTWYGLFAPAGTPRPVIDKLSQAVRQAAKADDVVKAWRPQGIEPLDGGPEDLARHMASEAKIWGDVAATVGLKR